MSKFLSNAAVQEFDSEVKHEYQGMGKLRNTVALRTNVTGDAYKFTRMGQGLANQKATQAEVSKTTKHSWRSWSKLTRTSSPASGRTTGIAPQLHQNPPGCQEPRRRPVSSSLSPQPPLIIMPPRGTRSTKIQEFFRATFASFCMRR